MKSMKRTLGLCVYGSAGLWQVVSSQALCNICLNHPEGQSELLCEDPSTPLQVTEEGLTHTVCGEGCASFQEYSICGLCAEPAKSTAIGCANCVGVLWLCLSLMICSFSHHESFWILAPSQLLYWSEIWPASKIFCLFLGLFLLSGSRQGAQSGVETSQKWGHLLLW